LTVKVVKPGSSQGNRKENMEDVIYPYLARDFAIRATFVKLEPETSEQKQMLLSLMREYTWVLNNHVLKVLSDKRLVFKVIKYGIPRDLYGRLFRTLKDRYNLPDWLIEGALLEATAMIRQWYGSGTLERGHRPIAKAPRLYVLSEWYNPKQGYLELPKGLRLRELGRNRKYDNYPNAKWARLVYREEYDAFFLELSKVIKVPPPRKDLRGALAVDINLNEIVVGNTDKYLERRYPTAFEKLDSYRKFLEVLRRKYPRNGSYDPLERRKGLRHRVWLTGRKMSELSKHSLMSIANEIVELALALGYPIVLEELKGLRVKLVEESNKPKEVKAKVRVMNYYKFDRWLIEKAKLHGIPVFFIDPRGTSTTCPRCGGKMVQVEDPVIGKRTMVCTQCGFKEDRDTVALINLTRRFLSSRLKLR
jgi:IS605 OrfB family transposase